MTEAETAANPPEEVKAELPIDDQKPKEEPEATPVEIKTETEEASESEVKAESEVKEESEAKAESEIKEEPAVKDEEDDKKAVDAKTGTILKTKGKIDYENPRNNRKFDPSVREVTDDPVAIRKQVRPLLGPPHTIG